MLRKVLGLSVLFGILMLVGTAFATDTIRYHGSSTILRAIMYKTALEFQKQEGVHIDLKGKSTGVGIEKLLAGECDFAGGGRPLKDKEKNQGLSEVKLFIDAYAIIVNNTCPLDHLKTSDFKDIMFGNISSWGDVGGAARSKIKIYSPPQKSAHYKNLKKLLGFKELPVGSKYADMTPSVLLKVKDYPTSIGWLSYANAAQNKSVKILEIVQDDVRVGINQENITLGKYPYSQGMYFYTKGEPTGNVKKLLNFIKSPKGDAIIKNAHFFLP
ncbi:MAG: substrate-binding domain-containing protein [Desulfobulbaceae bacterium]|nr:substrate-binding domain-containing protein [Desulfobulbaceae bacterium]